MNLLLDTHVLLWWLANSSRIKPVIRKLLMSPDVDIYVSCATTWEISIKQALKKLDAPNNLVEALKANRFTPLPVGLLESIAVRELPLYHRDPFDRLIVVHAQLHDLTLVTHDKRLKQYDVKIILA